MSLLPVAEALERLLRGVVPCGTEATALDQATRRVLAADLTSRLTQPPFAASAMDGYAVRALDTDNIPATLRVVGESAAGHTSGCVVASGEAVRIFTGAPVPEGADAIVIQENTKRDGDIVHVLQAVERGEFIRPRGIDFQSGEILVKAGTFLLPRHISLVAAMGLDEVLVQRQPRVAILATGDELVAPGEMPGPSQIISSSPVGLAGMIEAAGGVPVQLGIARDSLDSLDAHLAAAADADIVVTIGGASVGAHDLVQDALRARGVVLDFWKIAMRPGKPLMFGWRTLEEGGSGLEVRRQFALGLPGNPVSAFITARVFLVPLIHALTGLAGGENQANVAILDCDLEANGPRQHFIRGTRSSAPSGEHRVRPAASQDSSLLRTLAEADCLIVRPPYAPALRAGEQVSVLDLDF